MAEFEAQSLANTAWTWATLQVATDPLISAVARHALHQRLIRPLPPDQFDLVLGYLEVKVALGGFCYKGHCAKL